MPEGRNANEGFITVTSRASYEMVQKTASEGVSAIVREALQAHRALLA